MALPRGPTPRRCLDVSASGAADRRAWPSGDLHEVAQGGGCRVGAAVARGGGARLFRRPVLLVEVGAEVGDVSAVTPDTPPLPLPRVLVAQGLEFRFDLAMMVHILADLHVLGGSFPLGPRVAVLPVPLQPLMRLRMMARLGTLVACLGLAMGLGGGCGCWCGRCKGSLMTKFSGSGYSWSPRRPRVARWDWVPQRR